MSELDGILNFVQLTDDIGTAGQPGEEAFGAIARAGYAAVVNLALPSSDNAIDDEGRLVTGLGMSYVHLPVDFEAPTAEDLRRFIAVMRAFAGQRVFVHCAMNLRVSAFMYHFLKHERGLSDDAARSPVLARWEPRMTDVWRDFLGLSADEVLP
jgi:protein tyrosine phosphatase (PTP) superfamily phosphohydrolase (DUF442 family)